LIGPYGNEEPKCRWVDDFPHLSHAKTKEEGTRRLTFAPVSEQRCGDGHRDGCGRKEKDEAEAVLPRLRILDSRHLDTFKIASPGVQIEKHELVDFANNPELLESKRYLLRQARNVRRGKPIFSTAAGSRSYLPSL
jgi:hypothetical protein